MAEPRKIQKNKIPEMEALLEIIDNSLLDEEDKFMLELLNFDTTELSKLECSSEARTFALNLFYFSPKAYEFVISQYETCLPPVPILRTWFVKEGGVPGFTAETLHAIGEKVKQSEKKIYCSLIIRYFEDYYAQHEPEYVSGEGFYGFHDVGTEWDNSDVDNHTMASTALVFTVAAINAPWSLPIGYFLLCRYEKLATLVRTAIFLLEQKGVEVTAIPLEWARQINLAEALGCKLPTDGNEMELAKFVSESNKEIIVVPDIRKWLNMILVYWQGKGQFKVSKGSSIEFKYVKALESELGMTPKRKKTRSAWDSGSDSDEGIEICDAVTDRFIKLFKIKHEVLFKSLGARQAAATVKFLSFIDYILDIFNIKPNDPKLIVNDNTKNTVMKELQAICNYFATIQPIKNQFVNFTPFYIAAKGVIEIVDKLYSEEGIEGNISLDKFSFVPAAEIFAKIKCGSGTPPGRDVSARRFKIGYNEAIKELLAASSN